MVVTHCNKVIGSAKTHSDVETKDKIVIQCDVYFYYIQPNIFCFGNVLLY
jgi:hypothetical protein